MERITSRANPLCARIRKLNSSRAFRRETGLFPCENPKLVAEALQWGSGVEVLVTAEGVDFPAPIPAETRRVEMPADLLKSLSDVGSPQGVLALCALPSTAPPEELKGGRYLVLDALQDPGNLGTIWRTADALGADGLFLLPGCADPYSPKTVRATMGAAFRLSAWECGLDKVQGLLAAAGIPLLAAALQADTADVRAADLRRSAVIIGSEGRGVSPASLAACVGTVKIPMRARCESLNAAVAAALILWEMCRDEG